MDKNLNAYNLKEIIDWYVRLTEITSAEKAVFGYFIEKVSGNLLDIGIGGGRTTAYLADKCKNYIGIDYSEGFIEAIGKRFPDLNLICMDARDLSAFDTDFFDFVNFSFNGIDYVDLEGREKIFSEIHRVLRPGGLFFFSTHNKNHFSYDKKPWLDKDNSLIDNVKTFIKLLPFIYRKMKNKKNEIVTNDYSIINDYAHNYSLMTFYTSPAFLKKQLTLHNFHGVTFYSKSGKKTEDAQLDKWIFVTCLKTRA